MKRSLIGLLTAPTLMACVPTRDAATPSDGPKACAADKVQSDIGRRYDATLGEKMRKVAGAQTIRVLAPDTMATKDYRIDRLNIHIDAAGIVIGADCS